MVTSPWTSILCFTYAGSQIALVAGVSRVSLVVDTGMTPEMPKTNCAQAWRWLSAQVAYEAARSGPAFRLEPAWKTLLGWLVTVVASARGAPFWFNAIRRIAGRRPGPSAGLTAKPYHPSLSGRRRVRCRADDPFSKAIVMTRSRDSPQRGSWSQLERESRGDVG